jgi:Transcription factor WhiB
MTSSAPLRVCARCPVRDECADYALAATVTWDIWAGVWPWAWEVRADGRGVAQRYGPRVRTEPVWEPR